MEKTIRTILTVFYISLFSLTAIQIYLQKRSPTSVLGTTDVRACYLLKGYCSDSTRCPTTYDVYLNPSGFMDCKLNACCVRKSSYSPLSSSPTPTSVPTRTPSNCPWYTSRNVCPSSWFWNESDCITVGDGSRNCCCTERYPLTPTPIAGLNYPNFSLLGSASHYPLESPLIEYDISHINSGNTNYVGSLPLKFGSNCWYRKKTSSGNWTAWQVSDAVENRESFWANLDPRTEYSRVCYYRFKPEDYNQEFQFTAGASVYIDSNRNNQYDSGETKKSCSGGQISSTNNPSCLGRVYTYTISPPQTPTPTSAPRYQVESFSLRTPCGLDSFRYADYRCRIGTSGSLGETSSCKPVSVWWNNVYQICNSPQPTPTR